MKRNSITSIYCLIMYCQQVIKQHIKYVSLVPFDWRMYVSNFFPYSPAFSNWNNMIVPHFHFFYNLSVKLLRKIWISHWYNNEDKKFSGRDEKKNTKRTNTFVSIHFHKKKEIPYCIYLRWANHLLAIVFTTFLFLKKIKNCAIYSWLETISFSKTTFFNF